MRVLAFEDRYDASRCMAVLKQVRTLARTSYTDAIFSPQP